MSRRRPYIPPLAITCRTEKAAVKALVQVLIQGVISRPGFLDEVLRKTRPDPEGAS